jgi:putative transposase
MHTKAYKFRIYPSAAQSKLIDGTIGMVRKYWNLCVAAFNGYDEYYCPKPIYLTSRQFRKKFQWAEEYSASPIQQKFRDFLTSKCQYFDKKRKAPLGRMKFKSKQHSRKSYRLPNQKFSLMDGKIKLEKIGKVKCVYDRQIPEDAKLLSVTVSCNSAGQYFVSVCVEQDIPKKPKTGKTIALDVGVAKFYTDSEGNTVENPSYFSESQSNLARLQRLLFRKVNGSNRYRKLKLRIAKLHQKIADQRNWFLHQVSNTLIHNYDKIFVEDLNVKQLLKQKKLSKHISDTSWSKFFDMLSYKSVWYGKELVKIDRYFPSSKTCSNCGHVKKEIHLSERTYKCKNCGLALDRDHNAAINILAFGVQNA